MKEKIIDTTINKLPKSGEYLLQQWNIKYKKQQTN